MLKKIFLFLIILIVFNSAFSQRKLKYKDVYDIILTERNDVQAYTSLLEYQKQDPEFPNTYFQLGLISYKWAFEADPLIQIDEVEYFVYNTKLYLGLAKAKLTQQDRDVKKNRRFYLNIERFNKIEKINNEDVFLFIDEKMSEINKYDENAHKIAEYYNASVINYNNCVNIFTQLNRENNKLKDLYLAPNENILSNIDKLIKTFDSTIYYFQLYKTAINNYPINNYNQIIKEQPIETYKLEGLTNTCFLDDTIYIWDYKKWAEHVRASVKTDITNLRGKINQTNAQLRKKEKTISQTSTFSDNYTGFDLEKKLIFEIEKYDYESIITSLFYYLDAKIDFLVKEKMTYNNINDTTNNIPLQKKAILYNQLTMQKVYTDSLLQILNERNTPNKIRKFNDFFTRHYNGYSGLISFISIEKELLQNMLDKDYENFKYFIFTDFKKFKDSTYVEYRNLKIPLFITSLDIKETEIDQYHTTSITENRNGTYYITGFYKQPTSSQAFVAQMNNQNEIEWLKTSNISNNSYDYAVIASTSNDNCFTIIHSENETKHQNTLLKIDNSGKQLLKTELNNSYIPRSITYDDINQNLMLVYKDTNINFIDNHIDTLFIQKYNLINNEPEWTTQIAIKGNFFSLIKMDTTYFVSSNFQYYTNQDNEQIKSKAKNEGGTNILLTIISQSGSIFKMKPYFNSKSVFGLKAIKLNSEIINFTGLYGMPIDIQRANYDELKSLYYSLIYKNTNEYFKNNK